MLNGERWLENTLASNWYGILLSVIFLVWLIYRVVQRIARIITVSFLMKFRYSSLPVLLQYFDVQTAANALVASLYVALNVLAVYVRMDSTQTVNVRAGTVALFNLVLLFLEMRPSIPTNWLGIQIQTDRWAHRWIGRICAIEVLVHSCISLSNRWRSSSPIPTSRSSPLTAAGCILLVFLLTLGFVIRQRRWLVINTHQILVFVAVGFLWVHLAQQKSYHQWTLVAAVSIHVFLKFVSYIMSLWRNKRGSAAWPRASIILSYGVLVIRLKVPRQWSARPGQVIQLWCYGLGLRACCQTPALTIAYTTNEDGQRVLHFLARPDRRGFLRRLSEGLSKASSEGQITFRALALGPYGQSFDFCRFGTVLLIATDVGIAAVLPHVKELVEDSQRRRAMIHKVIVVWQIDDYAHTLWLSDAMQKLLDLDRQEESGFEILKFYNYYQNNYTQKNVVTTSSRIECINSPLDVEQTVRKQIAQRQGDMAIAVCAAPQVNQRVRSMVQSETDHNLCFVELESDAQTNKVPPWITPTPSSSMYHQKWVASRIKEGELSNARIKNRGY